jgi:hypothetical protein
MKNPLQMLLGQSPLRRPDGFLLRSAEFKDRAGRNVFDGTPNTARETRAPRNRRRPTKSTENLD